MDIKIEDLDEISIVRGVVDQAMTDLVLVAGLSNEKFVSEAIERVVDNLGVVLGGGGVTLLSSVERQIERAVEELASIRHELSLLKN